MTKDEWIRTLNGEEAAQEQQETTPQAAPQATPQAALQQQVDTVNQNSNNLIANVNQNAIQQPKGGDATTNTYSQSVTQGTQQGATSSMTQNTGKTESYLEQSPELLQQAAAERDRILKDKGFVRDENGKLVRDPNDDLYAALQVDREKLRQERERQLKSERQRELEAAIYNSGALVSEIVSAAIGGNVYQREKDTTAADAAAKIAKLKELQAAEDMAARLQERKDLDEAVLAGEKAYNEYVDRFGKKVADSRTSGQSTSTSTTNSTSMTQSSGRQATGYSQRFLDSRGHYGGGGSGKNGETVGIRVYDSNGNSIFDVPIPKSEKSQLISDAHNLLDEALKRGDITPDDLGDLRKETVTGSGLNRKTVVNWDDKNLLSSGIILREPRILNRYINLLVKNLQTEDGGSIDRVDGYTMITGIDPHDNNGNIDPSKVLRGVTLDGVQGTMPASQMPKTEPVKEAAPQADQFGGLFTPAKK